MDKYVILIIIIASAGTFGGLVKFFNSIDTSKKINWKEFTKYILTGIGAAILVPLFLNMISSDLIKADSMATLNYFVFAGFCFIGAYLSNRFLTTIGEKILNEVKQVKSKQESTTKAVDLLIENESEPTDSVDNSTKIGIEKIFQSLDNKIEPNDKGFLIEILKAFDQNGKYTFRSIKGIANELKYPEYVITSVIKAFEENGLIRKVRKRDDGQILWGITSLGKFMKNSDNKGGA